MEENHDEQHFTERELAGSHASATRRDQLFPLAIFVDLCKIIDTAKQSGDRRVHEGGILSVGFDFGTDTKSGSARFWNTHQPAYPELGSIGSDEVFLHVSWFFGSGCFFFLTIASGTYRLGSKEESQRIRFGQISRLNYPDRTCGIRCFT